MQVSALLRLRKKAERKKNGRETKARHAGRLLRLPPVSTEEEKSETHLCAPFNMFLFFLDSLHILRFTPSLLRVSFFISVPPPFYLHVSCTFVLFCARPFLSATSLRSPPLLSRKGPAEGTASSFRGPTVFPERRRPLRPSFLFYAYASRRELRSSLDFFDLPQGSLSSLSVLAFSVLFSIDQGVCIYLSFHEGRP
mmetsp:Transcript_12803/g.24986  ORF Transcript_12803/g.24986 Transcript_12803/m.24986 type:complete len:196 (+) Transcript_12803:1344-1931(+)